MTHNLLTHTHFMQLALEQAWQGRGECAPNPAVGAIVVRDGKIIAAGFHPRSGTLHAEIIALDQIAGQAQGADLYVTLEPCCHFGKTPPCTQRIKQEKIKHVFYGHVDPNTLVKGKGINQLVANGIQCELIELPEIAQFYKSYCRWINLQLPTFTLKLAMSLDGKIAYANHQRAQLTGTILNEYTHEQRKIHDAILTTATTINADNSYLNVRLPAYSHSISKPVYVLDSSLKLKSDLHIYDSARSLTLFYAAHKASLSRINYFMQQGIRCIAIDTDANGYLNLHQIATIIGQDGMHDIWIEAGGCLMQHFLQTDLVKRALIYIAPKILGPDAISAFTDIIPCLNSANHIEWTVKGNDVVCDFRW